MQQNETSKRTRINVSITAKGLAQWDITTEYETPELSQKALDDAIVRVRQSIKTAGLKEAGE